jgi:hypothetical protein
VLLPLPLLLLLLLSPRSMYSRDSLKTQKQMQGEWVSQCTFQTWSDFSEVE